AFGQSDGAANAPGTTGEIQFATTVKNFGKLQRGAKAAFEFPFENIGKGPLIIQGVHAGCGCTAVEAQNGRVYAPGDKGVVKVAIDTSNFSGHFIKMITVMTNEKLLSSRTLTVKAFIEDEVAAYPPVVDFGPVRPGAAPSKRVIVKPVGVLKNVHVEKLQYNAEAFTASLAQTGSE